MCGIVGAVHFSGAPLSQDSLAAAVSSLANRGPDGSGTWCEGPAQLGHRRLSIIDISDAGRQPMESEDGRFVIVFNGEIYNHLSLRLLLQPAAGWRGTSDTETLLAAFQRWGIDCVTRLDGMFAFAVWDRVERRLYLARDRIGEKPLYYAEHSGRLSFASRPGALRALNGGTLGEFDPDALAAYVDLGYVPTPHSIWRAVKKLQPAHYLTFDSSGLRLTRYWDFRHIRPKAQLALRPESELLDELDELITNAVRGRMLSDVPLGAFLSGGTDSSLILATMRKVASSRPVAFTIGFREPSYDESATAAAIARHLDVEHVTERLSVTSLLELLPECVAAFDEPIADSSSFPTMAVSRLARPRVTVALTGDAGDELFGGYHYYALAEKMAQLMRLPRQFRARAASVLNLIPSHRTKLLAEAMRRETSVKRFHFIRSMRKDFPSILTDEMQAKAAPSSWLFEASAASFALDLSPSEVGMRLDTAFVLADGFLQKVDVASMAYSLESRCVLTDHKIVEWAMRLPASCKLRDGATKPLLKALLARYLPASLVFQPKKGFGMPVAAWLRGPLRHWAEQLLNEDALFDATPVNRERVRSLFALHLAGKRDVHPLLWSTLMLLGFIAKHERGLELPPVARLDQAA